MEINEAYDLMAEMVHLFHITPKTFWKLREPELAAFIRRRDRMANS